MKRHSFFILLGTILLAQSAIATDKTQADFLNNNLRYLEVTNTLSADIIQDFEVTLKNIETSYKDYATSNNAHIGDVWIDNFSVMAILHNRISILKHGTAFMQIVALTWKNDDKETPILNLKELVTSHKINGLGEAASLLTQCPKKLLQQARDILWNAAGNEAKEKIEETLKHLQLHGTTAEKQAAEMIFNSRTLLKQLGNNEDDDIREQACTSLSEGFETLSKSLPTIDDIKEELLNEKLREHLPIYIHIKHLQDLANKISNALSKI